MPTKPKYVSPEQDAKIKEMWGSPATVKHIAEICQMGLQHLVSRARTLGLPKRGTTGHHTYSGFHVRSKKQEKKPRALGQETAYGIPTPLLALERNSCHWPVTEKPILFCAAKCDGVYCDNHKARAKRHGSDRLDR